MNQYDQIADWYDLYVATDRDLEYFRAAARNATAILDLMAGTGRVSLPMATVSPGTVTCIDRSRAMLQRLVDKSEPGHGLRAVRADVCELPLRPGFDLVVIPFNSIAEIVDRKRRNDLVAEIWRVLVPGGAFVCTLHNPVVRLQTLDGVSRALGKFDLPDSTQLVVEARGTIGADGTTAISQQTFKRIDGAQAVLEERTQTVHFALITREEFEATISSKGFELQTLHGDYDGTAFDPERSPFMIWRFCRPGHAAGHPPTGLRVP